MNLTIINDVHIGAVRTGGTTQASAYTLRLALLDGMVSLLQKSKGSSVLVNGDLFDTGAVPMSDLWVAVQFFSKWLKDNASSKVYLVYGNHDHLRNSSMLSSMGLFCKFLTTLHPSQAVEIKEPTAVPEHDLYVVPHLPNQSLFDDALKAVPKVRLVALHCNYDNKFAVEADHSLNLSPQQAAALPADFVILGHEHQRSTHLNGKVVIPGNQIPSSVADCLGNDVKYMLRVDEKGLHHIPVWEAKDDFARPDWRDLTNINPKARFIRVGGEASSEEASQVVAAISKLRSKSQALVITNGVSIDGVKTDDLALTLDSMKRFDVLAELLALLEPEEGAIIQQLMKDHHVDAA